VLRARDKRDHAAAYVAGKNFAAGLDAANAALDALRRRVEYLSMFDSGSASYSSSYKLFQTYSQPRAPQHPSRMPSPTKSPRSPRKLRPKTTGLGACPQLRLAVGASPRANEAWTSRTSPPELPPVNGRL